MSGSIDLLVVKYVLQKMSLQGGRRSIDPVVTQGHVDRAISLMGANAPCAECQQIISAYLKESGATAHECLQAFALYMDYINMAKLFGIKRCGEPQPSLHQNLAVAS